MRNEAMDVSVNEDVGLRSANSVYAANSPTCLVLRAKTPSSWNVMPLANVTDFQEGPGILAKDFTETGVPLLRLRNIENAKVNLEGSNFLSPEKVAKKWSHFALKEGDLLISTSASLGRVSVVGPEAINAIAYTGIIRFRSSSEKLNHNYLRAFLSSAAFVEQAEQMATGSVIKHFGPTHLKQMAIVLPSLDEQVQIAGIFDVLDHRIALLRETNATLEAIAQALFKSWFVDFDPVRAKQQGREPEGAVQGCTSAAEGRMPVAALDAETAALFPDSFEESELGLVPSGWRVGALEDCCERVESGGTPKRSQADYWNGDIAWITSGEVRNTIVFESKEKITNLGVKESSAKIWPTGTTIIAMYGATAGEVCILANPATANQACCGLIPSKNARSFLFFCTRRERKDLASKSSGSAQQNLNKGLVCNHKIVLPSANAVAAYEQVAGELLNGWIENEKQAQTLTTLRDTLLPRLISGQLRLPDAEALAEEAGA